MQRDMIQYQGYLAIMGRDMIRYGVWTEFVSSGMVVGCSEVFLVVGWGDPAAFKRKP